MIEAHKPVQQQSSTYIAEIKSLWNNVAEDWDIQVGAVGDRNRRLNSDPILWELAGDITGYRVLDAGCGTGYLSAILHQKGALVTGVDISDEMIRIAKDKNPHIDFYVDSCSSLLTIPTDSTDIIISNYVLMDTPDLQETIDAFNRVLKPDGIAIIIFSHPCFPQGRATVEHELQNVTYSWNFSYFDQCKQIDPPWNHFKSEFIWFHRPLSDYWKAFKKAGFKVIDFDEPHITPERYHLAENERTLRNAKLRPYSVVFKIQKANCRNSL